MADVEVTYNNTKIVELSESGTKTLKTAGKYCEGDIVLEYEKPAAGSTYIVISSIEGATLTCGSQTYTLGVGETMHAFDVISGTYTCVATKPDYDSATDSILIESGFKYVSLTPTFLPTTYQQVEYLYSNRNHPYINTGFVPDTTTKWVLDAQYDSFPSTGTYQNGTAQKTNADRFVLGITATNTAYFGMGAGVTLSTTGTERHTFFIDLPNNTYGIDNSSYRHQSSYTKSANLPIFLFNRNVPDINTTMYMAGKIYSSKIYDSGTLVQNMVPCYRKSDSVAGMYDKVNNTFFTNAGDGTFVVGPNV